MLHATEGVSAAPPGVVVAHSPAATEVYLGSPGIAVLPGGEYLAKCDEFGPKSSEKTQAITQVHRSSDRGLSWRSAARVQGMYWASVFLHHGAVYLLGTDRQNGRIVIARSDDAGSTWTRPESERSGVLTPEPGFHGAPVPVVRHGGRLWRAMEDTRAGGGWGRHFRALVMSAPADADLLNAANWTFGIPLARDPAWLDGKFGGWLEGNAVVSPEGGIVNLLRVDFRAASEKAALIRITEDGRSASFDAATGFIDFPGGCKKFTVRYDPVSRLYWSLANWVPPRHASANPERARNTLALTASPDLRRWQVRSVLLYHPDPTTHGFQYVDWLFDDDDLVAVVRTAFDEPAGQAHNCHDSNYLTFHRFDRFRALSKADSPAAIRDELPGEPPVAF
jgi:hypothetical protein